ncbi:MAG: hypothetical protein HC869_14145 [Rhodospirillales bacterium]|nr:hypothetical protein [Rhodospirillales bacterium]
MPKLVTDTNVGGMTAKRGARIEHLYCEPVAEALAADENFARFFFKKANCRDWLGGARCLKDEQAIAGTHTFWWKDWYCPEGRCLCPDLKGTQIDILAVFERNDGRRIGMHVECKHPTDKFSNPRQAPRYRERLQCWTQPGRGAKDLPPHQEAIAILICQRGHRHADANVRQFDAVIYFDEIANFISPYPAPEAIANV